MVLSEQANEREEASRERSYNHHYKSRHPSDMRHILVLALLCFEDARCHEDREYDADDAERVDHHSCDEDGQHQLVYPVYLHLAINLELLCPFNILRCDETGRL